MSEMHSVKECFRVGKVKILYKELPMEWLIGGLIFVVLAKKGLAKQGKKINVKDAASEIAANVSLEVAELLEINVEDTSAKGKRP